MKRNFIVVLISLFTCVFSAYAQDYETETLMATGVCGYNAVWNLYDSGRCEIYGNGSIGGYGYSSDYCQKCGMYGNHWESWSSHYVDGYNTEDEYIDMYSPTDFKDSMKKIEVSDGIESIEGGTFQYMVNLEEITLPTGITAIEDNLFDGCSSLKNIEIPENVTVIGSCAFKNCSELENIYIPSGVSEIASDAFVGCTSLSVEIAEDNQNFVTENGFILNKEKTEILYIPAGLGGCITIPEGITKISDGLFSENQKVTEVIVPESVTSIGENAFANCTALTKVTLPDSLTYIGSWVFSGCTSLKSINIPDGITSLRGAFSGCTSLETVDLPGSITDMSWTFENCTSLVNITIPESVTEIGLAFYGCTALKSVTLPQTLETIGWSSFSGCTALTQISIPNSVTGIEYEAFYNCSSLTQINIPNSVTCIGDNAFCNCSSLSSVILPDSLEVLGYGVFGGCGELVEIEVPKGITDLKDNVFVNCAKLKKVVLPEGLNCIGEYSFQNCKLLENINLPESLERIAQTSFSNVPLFNPTQITEDYYVSGWLVKLFKTDATEYTIGKGKKIYPKAFSGSGITTIYFEEGVTEIQPYQFYRNTEIKYVHIPVSVTEIGDYAFGECTSLESVTFEEKYELALSGERVRVEPMLKTIGSYAFYADSKLESFEFTDNLEIIGGGAFSECAALCELGFGESLKEISYNAFRNCVGLTELYIPENVDCIGEGAFYGCNNLNVVSIAGSLDYDNLDLDETELSAQNAFREYSQWGGYTFVDTIYIGGAKNNYYSAYDYLGISANHIYYLNGCLYDTNNKILEGTVGEIEACIDNGKDFCKNVYIIKIKEGVKQIRGSSDTNYSSFPKLHGFILPESLERIEENAFFGVEDIYVTIPKNVSYIYPLCGWGGLLGAYVDPDNEHFCSDGVSVYSKDGTKLVRAFGGEERYTVPEHVTYIYDFALNSQEVVIHNGVTKIGYGAFSYGDVYYKGTKHEWDNIEIEEQYSEYVLHYNYGQKMPETKCEFTYGNDYESSYYTLSVSFDEIEVSDNSRIFALGTDGDGKTTFVSKTLTQNDTSSELILPKDILEIKIFIWESMENMRPLSIPEEITLAN